MGKRVASTFVCQQCGYQSPAFLGRCPSCQAWNSLVETLEDTRAVRNQRPNPTTSRPVKLAEISNTVLTRQTTGITELDLVLGGGVVPGMVTLLTGEPGIGKSTLLLDLAANWPDPVLYVAGEESASQIKLRAQRLGITSNKIIILEATDVDAITEQVSQLATVSLIIVDSVQTLTTGDLAGMAGTVGQVRECSARLIAAVKPRGIPLFLVGHVTKEGTIAGPKVLEHAVDTIILLEGEKFSPLRLVRSQKNRFGPTDEVGVFEMTEGGFKAADVANLTNLTTLPSGSGSCLTVALEGSRPILVEIQALVTSTPLPNPRRVGAGVSYNRLLTIVAILQKHLNLPLYKEDIYVNVAGGLSVTEPAADLAIALAIISSYRDKPLAPQSLAIGELDLLGHVRPVQNEDKRLKEAKKLGLTHIFSSSNLRTLSQFSHN